MGHPLVRVGRKEARFDLKVTRQLIPEECTAPGISLVHIRGTFPDGKHTAALNTMDITCCPIRNRLVVSIKAGKRWQSKEVMVGQVAHIPANCAYYLRATDGRSRYASCNFFVITEDATPETDVSPFSGTEIIHRRGA